jgi:hypothetical protein
MHSGEQHGESNAIRLPSPTAWPMVLALGISLVIAGMVTNLAVGILGLLLAVMGAVGWFLQVLPEEAHEAVAVHDEVVQISSHRTLMRIHPADPSRRKILPLETFHITTGIKGGIAGGIAMTVPAGIFSVLKYHSFWYATNLLAAGGFVSWAGASDAFLGAFHWQGALAALFIHGVTSLLVGLLYGAMLQMFPRYPIFTAGLMVPVIFTGVVYSALGIVSPILDQRIDWFWFVISQIFFGLVCGYVVNLQARVRTPQFQALPFAVRAGLHGDMTALTGEDEDASRKEDPR